MADKTTNLNLTLTNDTDATTTTFKQWRESINGETDSNMLKIDGFAGTTNEALTNKVDKETGKGLSTNDFTNADKAKVDAIPADPKYTDTTYTAGNGINISASNVISGDFLGLFESKKIIASTPTAPYNDCNTLPANTCVSYAEYVNSSALANKPSSFNNGTIMTWSAKTGTSIVTQLAVNGSNVMWHRAKYVSTWTAWVQEMTDSSVHSRSYTAISMFDKVGIVGDSFASGATYGVEGVGDGVHYGSAWGRVLSKRNNISVNIFAASGLSTKTWLENSHGLTALQAADPQDLYLLCLGINDNKTGADPIGTVSDINDNDYTQNPSTFFGNYGRIVAQIKIHAPTSKLIFIVPTGYKTNNIGIAISQIAEHYAVPCIRLDDDPFFYSSFYQDNLHTGHPVGITYAGMATAIERLYSKCVIDNPTYFIDYISKYSYTYNNEGNVLTTGDNNLTGNNTFTGANTFNGAVTVPTPTADNQAATKKYVDEHSGGGGDVTAVGNNTFTGTNTFNGIVKIGEGTTLNPTGLHTIKNDCNFEGSVNILNSITLVPENVDTESTLRISVSENKGEIIAARTIGGTIASTTAQFVVGTYNVESDDALFIIGNGTKSGTTENRKNVFEITKSGIGKLNNQNILTASNIKTDIAKTLTGYNGSNTNQVLGHDTTGNFKWTTNSASITSATASATTLPYYESATASVTLRNGVLDFTFGIPQGEPGDNTCLIEGTKITMADGYYKAIEELKEGDEVLSYNPVTKEKVTAIVLACYQTGVANRFDVYSFEDGNFITAYKVHGFFANDIGYIRNIQNITRNNELINQNLEYTYLIKSDKMNVYGAPKARYNLIVSNNLYFANGILLGHTPQMKGSYYIKYNKTISEAIKSVFDEEIDSYNAFNSLMNTAEFHAEIAESQTKLYDAINEIRTAKANLSATDYKVQKYTEGVLSDEEWEESKAKRAAWRQIVNDNETLQHQIKVTVNEIVSKYRHGVTPKQLFENCCKKDNELFETIKNYFEVK